MIPSLSRFALSMVGLTCVTGASTVPPLPKKLPSTRSASFAASRRTPSIGSTEMRRSIPANFRVDRFGLNRRAQPLVEPGRQLFAIQTQLNGRRSVFPDHVLPQELARSVAGKVQRPPALVT